MKNFACPNNRFLVRSPKRLVILGIAVLLAFSNFEWLEATAEAVSNKELPRRITNKFGMEFVEVPAGRFYMGRFIPSRTTFSSVEYLNTQLHPVEISKPFFLGVTEVTSWHESQIGIAAGHTKREEYGIPSSANQQATCIASWNEAVELAATLSKLDPDYKYRLPTEAEWEYACRGQVNAGYPKKSDEIAGQSHSLEHGMIEPVKMKPPNAFGLYDMLRNVGEYCSDWHSMDYYNRSPLKNPQGPAVGKNRIARGFRGTIVWQRNTVPPEGNDNILIGVRFVLEEKESSD